MASETTNTVPLSDADRLRHMAKHGLRRCDYAELRDIADRMDEHTQQRERGERGDS